MLRNDDLQWLEQECPTPVETILKPDEIQSRALKTWVSTGRRTLDILKAASGVCCEGTELFNLFNRSIFKGKPLTRDMILDEAGDVLYYLSVLLYQLGITVDELSMLNREKLKDGKHGWKEQTS